VSPSHHSKGDVMKETPSLWSSTPNLGGCCFVFWRRKGKWVEREWRN